MCASLLQPSMELRFSNDGLRSNGMNCGLMQNAQALRFSLTPFTTSVYPIALALVSVTDVQLHAPIVRSFSSKLAWFTRCPQNEQRLAISDEHSHTHTWELWYIPLSSYANSYLNYLSYTLAFEKNMISPNVRTVGVRFLNTSIHMHITFLLTWLSLPSSLSHTSPKPKNNLIYQVSIKGRSPSTYMTDSLPAHTRTPLNVSDFLGVLLRKNGFDSN